MVLSLTFWVVDQSTHSFKAEVLGHELAHLFEETRETSLGAYLWCQLQGVNNCLLFFVDFKFGLDFFDLHG